MSFTIERRILLWKLPMATAAFLAAVPQALHGRGGPLTWDEFATRTSAMAKELYESDQYDEEVYIHRLAAESIAAPDVPATARTGRFGKLDPPVEFGPVFRSAPIMIVQWKLAPGAWLPPHNHPNYNVLSVGLEGEAVVTHYDVEGHAPAFDVTSPFTVRRTRETIIGPRRVSELTSARDNIHTFRAGPNGARGIDIITLNTKDVGFSFLHIESKPRDAARATFAAQWIGPTPPEK